MKERKKVWINGYKAVVGWYSIGPLFIFSEIEIWLKKGYTPDCSLFSVLCEKSGGSGMTTVERRKFIKIYSFENLAPSAEQTIEKLKEWGLEVKKRWI